MKKKTITLTLLLILCAIGLTGCGYSSKESCEWCGDTPTKQFKVGAISGYYCEDCSSNCMLCGEKATKQYAGMLGNINFVCDDCYRDIKSWLE